MNLVMDRMTSFNNGSVKMVYDGDGNRVAKTVGGVTTQHLVDELNRTGLPQVMDEVVKSGVAQRTYLYGPRRISQTQVTSETTSYYGYDAHGDVRYLMNSGGEVTDTYDYDAFGNLVGSTGTTPNVYRYQGEALDSETGLYYLRARYYDPTVGRFLNVDPMTDQGEHPYEYAAADPVNGHDPTGQDVEDALLMAAVMPPMPQISGTNLSVKCLASMTLSALSIPGQWMNAVTACQATPVGGGTGPRRPPGTPGKPGNPPKNACLDMGKLVDYMDKTPWDTSHGQCAKYVHLGLVAAGAHYGGWAIYPINDGSYLLSQGYTELLPRPSPTYAAQPGDIVVLWPPTEYRTNGSVSPGHEEVWDGNQWVSDFKQWNKDPIHDIYPGSHYRNANKQYHVYRYVCSH